jgi:DNA adenine methylase
MRAIFKYPGSKWSIASWIVDHFPEHHSYLEPFFGSGAVFFRKNRSKIETINDLDGDVVNFFICIRDKPERLAAYLQMTPYSRKIYDQSCEELRKKPYEKLHLRPGAGDCQRAARFVAKMMMGFGFRTNEYAAGFKRDIQGREAAYAANDWAQLPDRIRYITDRLKGVQIENRPAIQLIREFNYKNVLIYADPPYVMSSRSYKRPQYRYEMTDNDHIDLLDQLLQHKGPVIVSGYDNPIYNESLQSWNREEIIAQKQTAGKSTEIIWMNFEVPSVQLSVEDVC